MWQWEQEGDRRQQRSHRGCVLMDINTHSIPVELLQWAKTLTTMKLQNSTDMKSWFLKVWSLSLRVSIQEHQNIQFSTNSRFFRNLHLKFFSPSDIPTLSHSSAQSINWTLRQMCIQVSGWTRTLFFLQVQPLAVLSSLILDLTACLSCCGAPQTPTGIIK